MNDFFDRPAFFCPRVPEFQIKNSVPDFPDFHIPFFVLVAASPYAFLRLKSAATLRLEQSRRQ